MTGCCTPGLSIARAYASEIPKSARGSSIFSPGEAFWNEAIQIADSLFSEDGNLLAQAAEDIINGNCGDKSRELLGEAGSSCCQRGNGGSLEFMKKHMKYLVKEASPLPVKHLDFLFDDKNLDVSTPRCATDNSNTHKGGEQSERGSVNLKSSCSQTTNITTYHREAQTKAKMDEAEETTSVHAVTTMKVDLSNQDADKIRSTSPINEIRNPVGNNINSEAGTPSSFVPLKDRLDLSNWLPSEICSIYKRRGISKLYPWQVSLKF